MAPITEQPEKVKMQPQQDLDQLFRGAIRCNECFKDGHLRRSFIDVAHPRLIGKNYWACPVKILVLMINPGKGRDDDAHRQAAERIRAFGSGRDTLAEIFQSQRDDLPNWGKFMSFYVGELGLRVDDIALANVAWCSTEHDKYPDRMLDECFDRHTGSLVRLLNPDAILLSGSSIGRFKTKIEHLVPNARVILAPHYANREGCEYNQTHARRIRSELDGSALQAVASPLEAVVPDASTCVSRIPPPDFPADFYTRTMLRHRPEFAFRPGKRNDIWNCWTDGWEVGTFVTRAREIGVTGGGIEDVRIYIDKDLVRFNPPLTAAEHAHVRPPRRTRT